MDPFHVVQWATDAVDAVRRALYRAPHYWSRSRAARAVRGTRWISRPDRPPDWPTYNGPTDRSTERTSSSNGPLVFQLPLPEAMRLLDRWLVWARRSQIEQFVRLAQTITEHRDGIPASLEHGASNGRVEAMNTGIRLLARMAYGFHTPDALIALALLKHGGLCPPLPGRLLPIQARP